MWDAFERLIAFKGGFNSASALAVDRVGMVFLCKGADGAPFYLVRVGPNNSRPSFRLRYITFQFDLVFEMDISGPLITDTCVKISCDDQDIFRQKAFVESISAVVAHRAELQPMPFIDALIQLFSRPSRRIAPSALGLWGELLFIYSCGDCDAAVLAWHLDPNQVRDFVFQDKAIEVKTTASGSRLHHFSLPQILSAQDGDLLCSVMVEATSAGQTLMDLALMIDGRCGPERKITFWSKLMSYLEDPPQDHSDLRFGIERSLQSIRFYELKSLSRPSVGNNGQGAVGDVTFSLTL